MALVGDQQVGAGVLDRELAPVHADLGPRRRGVEHRPDGAGLVGAGERLAQAIGEIGQGFQGVD